MQFIQSTFYLLNFKLSFLFYVIQLLDILRFRYCKHSWDPNMYAAFTDLIPRKARWWPYKGSKHVAPYNKWCVWRILFLSLYIYIYIKEMHRLNSLGDGRELITRIPTTKTVSFQGRWVDKWAILDAQNVRASKNKIHRPHRLLETFGHEPQVHERNCQHGYLNSFQR